jgi:hypothetical protein
MEGMEMKRWMTRTVALAVGLAAIGSLGAPSARGEVTDEQVRRAIEAGRQYLIKEMNPNGSFGKDQGMLAGKSALAFMTLAYMGEHPNREHMSKGLDYLLTVDGDRGFNNRQGYAVPIRIMGLSYVHNKLLGEKRAMVRVKMLEDLARLEAGQAHNGGWRYELKGGNDFDFSVTQWPILAMREANLVGVEFKTDPLLKARALYLKAQEGDGGWAYQMDGKSYGSMTAAGLASLFIIADVLEPASGCPCRGGQSQSRPSATEHAIDKALAWLGQRFSAKDNPGKGDRHLYWLYCVERVGIAAGYKYFGSHNWYKEGAEVVLKAQKDGHWGSLDDTCFALLFLYKGRAPILFNKLKYDGEWNNHRRDIANLTHFIERTKEQQFHWQIVELGKAPLEELHDAPVLYITAETPPKMSEADKKKLREFTDTGGTILFEASCGNPAVRRWFQDFAREVWPEWPLKTIGPEHGTYTEPYLLKQRPEILGVDDGVRTCVFYSMDDISCPWQLRAVAARGYLFNWGINLYTYATDGAPLRAKLAGRAPPKTDRYKTPVKGGGRRGDQTLRIARVQHGGNWEAGVNYGGLKKLAGAVKSRAGLTLDVKENATSPVNKNGVTLANLSGTDVAYIGGSSALVLKPEEKEALKAYVAKGGLVWFEAVTGAAAFDQSLKQLAAEMKWDLKILPATHPLMSGKMDGGAVGYNLAAGVEFRQSLRVQRLGRQCADLFGVYQGDKVIGVYSPLDVVFSLSGLEAYKCKGYKADDAAAVATNLACYFSTLK